MAEEFIRDTAEVRSFIGEVKEIVPGAASVEERLVAIRPLQLADGRPLLWPKALHRTREAGGMGKGIYQLAPLPGNAAAKTGRTCRGQVRSAGPLGANHGRRW